jgi:hypothetical protein
MKQLFMCSADMSAFAASFCSYTEELPELLAGNFSFLLLGLAFWIYIVLFFAGSDDLSRARPARNVFLAALNLALFAGLLWYVYTLYSWTAVIMFLVIFVIARFAFVVLRSLLWLIYAVLLPGSLAWFLYDRFTDNALSKKACACLNSLNGSLLLAASGLIVLKASLPVISYLLNREKPGPRFWTWVGAEVFSVACAWIAVTQKSWPAVLAAFVVSALVNTVLGGRRRETK